MTVPGIFLAAGEGRRFGDGKLLSLIKGEPLVVKSLRGPLESSLKKIIVVLGFQAEPVKTAVKDSFGDNPKIIYAENPGYREGMISSFNCGLAALKGDEPGAMMLLGDMPFVSVETIDRLMGSWNGSDILIPEVKGKLAHPRIIPAEIFCAFLNLDRFDSGKIVLEKYRKKIKTLSMENGKEFRDVDRKDDIPGF